MAWQSLVNGTETNDVYINAIAEAEAGLLECMSDLFYNNASPEGTLVENVKSIADIDTESSLIKDILCTYACKELTIADIFNSLSCKVALESALIKDDCDCKCSIK
ncbi:hypothetical protein [Clostridium sp. BJN0001]|uniref:hypothetical protein n=1 Tax=Clostridium sp. BJN0001 TaxID=2930219 RepID=UPI001FCFBF38|nr:hypothetical protein [Clostridium sp. BJN0001]